MQSWKARLSYHTLRRYIGYPGFALFMASDLDLMVFGGFDKLNTWPMLFLQTSVVEVEERLEQL